MLFKLDFVSKLSDLFSRKEKIHFLIVVLLALLMALFQAVGIASILPFINMVMDPVVIGENGLTKYLFEKFDFNSSSTFIVFYGILVLALLVVGNAISAIATWSKIHFVWKKNHTLSRALLKKYLYMPYEYFLNENTADLGKNVLSEVQQLTSNFLLPLIKIITSGIVTIVIVVLLLVVDFKTTIIAAAVLVLLYAMIYFYYSDRLKKGGKRRLQENKERYKKATETLSGIKDIKVLSVEKFFLQRFSVHSSEFSKLQSWYQVVGRVTRYLMEVVAFGGIVGLIVYLVAHNISTDEIIPLVSFFAFAGYRLMPALQEVFNSVTTFKFNKAVLNQVHQDMTTSDLRDQKSVEVGKELEPISFESSIKLEKVFFSYVNGKKNVLKEISIEIPKNKFVAFIGETGSGKTTLIDLLLGLLVPSEGGLFVDDVEIKGERIKRWQANVGYVPQQIYLSDDTITRNIAYGLSDDIIDMQQVKKVAKMANLNNFIDNELSEGYDTMIGERGIRLSGGQRQRIGIARALYHDPEILLLDEATSSLDDATEKEVLRAIEDVSRLKTMIVIAHRLTTVKNCDHLYLLKNGKIEEEGSYEEVIGNKQKTLKKD